MSVKSDMSDMSGAYNNNKQNDLTTKHHLLSRTDTIRTDSADMGHGRTPSAHLSVVRQARRFCQKGKTAGTSRLRVPGVAIEHYRRSAMGSERHAQPRSRYVGRAAGCPVMGRYPQIARRASYARETTNLA